MKQINVLIGIYSICLYFNPECICVSTHGLIMTKLVPPKIKSLVLEHRTMYSPRNFNLIKANLLGYFQSVWFLKIVLVEYNQIHKN